MQLAVAIGNIGMWTQGCDVNWFHHILVSEFDTFSFFRAQFCASVQFQLVYDHIFVSGNMDAVCFECIAWCRRCTHLDGTRYFLVTMQYIIEYFTEFRHILGDATNKVSFIDSPKHQFFLTD